MPLSKQYLGITISVLALLLSSCGSDDSNTNVFRLQLLHIADMDGDGAAAVIENAPRVSAIVDAFRAEYPDRTLFLSSGDNFIPGPTFSASDDETLRLLLGAEGAGRGDIVILNEMGLQASALGNHEFDNGADALAGLIAPQSADFDDDGSIDGTYPGAAFPYLSSNINFDADADLEPLVTNDGQDATALAGRIAGSVTLTVANEIIGIVGATTPTLASIASPGDDVVISPSDSTDLDALAALIQQRIDALTAQGITKIILLAHMQQFSIEDALTERLHDIDILVAGGSNTILADSTDRLRAGDSAADTYPLIRTSSTGDPIALVNCGFDYRYVCRLAIDFDDDGVVRVTSINADESGSWAADEQGLVELNGPIIDAEVAAISQGLSDVLATREGNTFGKTTVFLEGRRANVRTEETNLANLTADANLAIAQSVDPSTGLSVKNGGGIRAAIGQVLFPPGSTNPDEVLLLPPPANAVVGKAEGQISQFDIQNSLRFNNELTLLTVTAQELVAIIEHGVAATEAGATPGRFPQIGGLRFSFNPDLPPSSRVQSLLVLDSNGAEDGGTADTVVVAGQLQGDPNRTFRLVTLSFLADGGDDYPFPARNRVDLPEFAPVGSNVALFADFGTEQDALAEYLAARFSDSSPFTAEELPVSADERIQNLATRTDTVLNP